MKVQEGFRKSTGCSEKIYNEQTAAGIIKRCTFLTEKWIYQLPLIIMYSSIKQNRALRK